jgi:tetratricopeptide (TPR) repeat protein
MPHRAPLSLLPLALSLGVLASSGCRGGGGAASVDPEASAARSEFTLNDAEALLEGGEAARAVAVFTGLVRDSSLEPAQRHSALLGLARAHEGVGDFESARSAYEQVLSEDPDATDAADSWARRGAVEAELQDWARSAQSFGEAYASLRADQLVSYRIELLARQGYAFFSAENFESCDGVLSTAEKLYAAELESPTERFSTYYFVGMMRFYRAALIHTRFRGIEVRLPEARMAKDFEAKLELLTSAQEAYNDAIRVKHVYWVSAAGYQLGTIFEEFYDALMHAPVPEWLDESQKADYYEELKAQLRPVVNKAIWVFEKNLESARRIGYENPFVEQTREALGRLQSILLAADHSLGSPHPRLVQPLFGPEGSTSAESGDATALGPLDRKLHLPTMTPL